MNAPHIRLRGVGGRSLWRHPFIRVTFSYVPLMEDKVKNSFDPLRAERLSDTERIRGRNVIMSYMAEHPLTSSMHTRVLVSLSSIFSSTVQAHTARALTFATALVLVVGVGTSYAAEGALPGEPLYEMKVRVVEPLRGVLAVSEVSKAKWDTERISRRLAEAEVLAARGELDEESRTEIETRILATAEEIEARIETSEGGSRPVISADVHSELEATLVSHERVLAVLGAKVPNAEPSVRPLIAVIRERADKARDRRERAERAVTASAESGDDRVRIAAVAKKDDVAKELGDVRTMMMAPTATGTSQAADDASTSARSIQRAIDDGDEKMSEGEYAEAFGTFQAALRAVKAVRVHLDAEGELKTELSVDDNDGGEEEDEENNR